MELLEKNFLVYRYRVPWSKELTHCRSGIKFLDLAMKCSRVLSHEKLL